MEYVTLTSYEGFGSDGGFGVKILVAADKLPNLNSMEIYSAADFAKQLVEGAVCAAIKAADPKTAVAKANNKKVVTEVFTSSIFVEEIPNGYCKKWCCTHLPWFIVTTKVGRFTIGWRKSVINIDWSETVGTKLSSELFKGEDVTKGRKYIHAWSIKDAKSYVKEIIESAKQ